MKVVKTTPEQERRFKIVYLPHDWILNTFCMNPTLPGHYVNRISFENVPDGTQVVDHWYDHLNQSEVMLLYNPVWPSVPHNEKMPIIETVVRTVVVDLRVPREPTDCLQPISKQVGVVPVLDWKADPAQKSGALERYEGKYSPPSSDLVPKEHETDLIARLTETPSLDSLFDRFGSMADVKESIKIPIDVKTTHTSNEDGSSTDRFEITLKEKENETWRDRKPLL